MPAQRPLQHIRPALASLGALALAGCGIGDAFALYPVAESAIVAEAPWPTLLDTVTREAAAGAPLIPATGATVVDALGAQAAISAEQSARLSGPVLDIAPLRAEADAAKAGRP